MTRIVVQKYGGSSLATPAHIQAVARNIVDTRERGHDVVVVVSAMGKSTNELLALAHQVSAQPSRRELDMLLSVGERISMALLSMAVADLGQEAISFTGSQCGIMTNDRHVNARIVEVRPFRVQDELERGRVVIIAGFQGTSYRREVTTLGRGGSDTTAVAMAAALGGDCEIYSDVDGVYSADPRVVPTAAHLPSLDYDEMGALARAGAKVLNAEAIRIAREQGIAVYARATADPGGRETVVRRNPSPQGALVRGVASRNGLVLLRGPAGPGLEPETLQRLVGAQAVLRRWTKQAGLQEYWFDPRDQEIPPLPGLERIEPCSSVTVVGRDVDQDPALVGRVQDLVAGTGLPLEGLQLADCSITLLLGAGDPSPAVRLLHHELIERDA